MAVQLTRRTALLSLVLAAGLIWPPVAAAPVAPHGAGPAPTNDCFIRSIYRDVLGRVPGGPEISFGLAFLDVHTNEEYATVLLTSDEYRILLLQDWYQKFLGRAAGGIDVSFGLSLFHSGSKAEEIMAAILGSPEYFNQGRVGNDNSNWVAAVYEDVLGRPADKSEIDFWVAVINAPNQRSDVAHSILTSVEYQNDIVQAWYQRFLGRAAGSGEVTAARTIINNPSGTDEQAIAAILGSVEYYARAGLCATYLPLVIR